MNIFKSRKFRQGSIATAITVLGVVLIILLNTVLSALSNRFNWELDLTSNQIFQISDDNKEYLANLQKDVNIYILNDKEAFRNAYPQEYMTQADEILKKYENASEHINVSYVNIVQTPTFVSKYADLALNPNQILIEEPATGKTTVVNSSDLFNYRTNNYGQQSIVSSKAEQVMTSAILNVTSDKKIKVTMLTGHNETEIHAFTDLLTTNNYEIITQNLLTEEKIDPEATIALMAAPQRDLNEDELKKLDAFLYNDNNRGKIFFYITSGDLPDASGYPNLSAWLNEWGIAVGESVAFEMDANRRLSATDPMVALASYAEDEFSASVKAKQMYPAILYSKPLSLLWTEKGARTARTLLEFSAQSGVMPAEINPNANIADQLKATGPVATMIMATELRYDQLTPLTSHVVVSGSLYSFDQQFLGMANYANSEYYLDFMNTISNREDTIKIQDKTITFDYMEMTLAQINVIRTFAFILLPIALLATGIIVWLRRRHK